MINSPKLGFGHATRWKYIHTYIYIIYKYLPSCPRGLSWHAQSSGFLRHQLHKYQGSTDSNLLDLRQPMNYAIINLKIVHSSIIQKNLTKWE